MLKSPTREDLLDLLWPHAGPTINWELTGSLEGADKQLGQLDIHTTCVNKCCISLISEV